MVVDSPYRQMTQLEQGMYALRAMGHTVEASPGVVPGLYDVSGMGELTTGQVASFANRQPWPSGKSLSEALIGFNLFSDGWK